MPGTRGSASHEPLERLTLDLEAVGRRADRQYLWQRTEDPYVVFVAEYFLRRSNRSAVSRHLPGFLDVYPTAPDLAAADPADVVRAARWAGMTKRTMQLPSAVAAFLAIEAPTAEALEMIPYVGPYAAQAVALYAFGQDHFPVDGNVRRVFGRHRAVDGSAVHDVASQVLNVAKRTERTDAVRMTHLGVLTVGWEACRARPKCDVCPLAEDCRSRQMASRPEVPVTGGGP